jgi:anti-sigma regulatory factor (Ser/Thr protein kinase)
MDKLDYGTFDKLLEKQNPFLQENPTLNLDGISLITPSGFVRLAAVCFALSKNDKRLKIILKDKNVLSYAVRNGFTKTIAPVADMDPPLPRIAQLFYETFAGKNGHLIEITKITSPNNILEVLMKIQTALSKELHYSSTDSHPIIAAVSEACQNTFHHNQAVCGFIAMQIYQQKKGSLLEVAISDYGDGLRATLTRNPIHQHIKSDHTAIIEAIKEGVSEFSDSLRGVGLYQLLKIIEEHGHSLNIRSGSAKIHFKVATKQFFKFQVPDIPGVHITLCFRAK